MVELFANLVTQEEWSTAKSVNVIFTIRIFMVNYTGCLNISRDLIMLMKMCGKMLVSELPLETSAENMVLRLLKIVRDEYTAACHQVNI